MKMDRQMYHTGPSVGLKIRRKVGRIASARDFSEWIMLEYKEALDTISVTK